MSLEFNDIRHSYDGLTALAGISLTAAPGQITCLLGPSGCGKTTLLRLAAGLLSVQQGEIVLDGTPLASPTLMPPPEARPVGLVFQEGALFPHLNVSRNIGFGVADKADQDKIVADLLGRVGLEGFGSRYPHTLSGGQQQRVALARALAPEPRVLLLDEPFANVDIVLRRELRERTRRLLKNQDAIAVLVTHDPEEAMMIGDTIAVMDAGHIVQVGAPQELFDQPATTSVAMMIGDGQVVHAEQSDGALKTAFGIWPAACINGPLPAEKQLDLLVRPDAVHLEPGESACLVEDVRHTGTGQLIFVTAGPSDRLSVLASSDEHFSEGCAVRVVPAPGRVFAFPAAK